MNRKAILLVSFVCFIYGTAGAAESPVANGTEAGQSMPFHVVHFVGGARDSGKGCPSVMISNAKIRGIEIWSESPSEAVFELAQDIDSVLDTDQKNQAFMILGQQEKIQDVKDLAQKHRLRKLTVCVPNSKKLFQKAGFTDQSDLLVFFMERKEIKAAHKLKVSDLSAESRQKLAREFRDFLGSNK